MLKKIIIALLLLLGLAAAAGGVWYYSAFVTPVATQTSTATSTPQPQPPQIAGPVAAITPNSITITMRDGSPKTLSVTSSTQIISTVAPGQQALVFADIKVGAQVYVEPTVVGGSDAKAISVYSNPNPAASPAPLTATAPQPQGKLISFSGTIQTKYPSRMVIKNNDGTLDNILITKNTVITSVAANGGAGYSTTTVPLGTPVVVTATIEADYTIAADSIQFGATGNQ